MFSKRPDITRMNSRPVGLVTAELGEVAPEKVTAELVHAGVGVRGLTVEAPSLEDLFVGLTGEGFDVER